jgi:hypothetical protein
MATPGAMALADLRTAARQRSDTENDPHISDSELTTYLNQSAFELYDLIVDAYGDNYFLVNPDYVFVTDGVHDVYPFPDGSATYLLNDGVTTAPAVYKPLGVDLSTAQGQPGTWLTLYPFNNAERNSFGVPGQVPYVGMIDLRYNFRGNNLWFVPLPAGNQTARMLYVPRMSPLVNDTDLLDGVSGWTEYVIVDAAIKCMQKQETDPSDLRLEKAALRQRIDAMKLKRNAGHPHTVQRTRRNQFGYDFPWQGGRGPFGQF